jgi:ubiquitin C-terminal hydrolase
MNHDAGTRKAALKLLIELVTQCPANYAELISHMLSIHSMRELRPLHMYQPSQLDKACGFVGLKNLGATCYMNSLLQQLYHTPEFRAEILKV